MSFSYKSSITFGLVYIPVRLFNVIKSNEIGFNMLDKKSNSRVAYKKVSASTGEEVRQEDIVKAYQYDKEKYVVFEDADFEKIKSPKDKSINIENFVNIIEIDPVYYEKAYYVVPEGAEKAFVLLKEAMESEGKIGIAKTVLGTKECVIALRINNGNMLLNTLYFNAEIQKNPMKEININAEEKELRLAKMIINGMLTSFNPSNYNDEYSIKLQQAIEEKIKGKEITLPKTDKPMPNAAISLMEALEKTLNEKMSGNEKSEIKKKKRKVI